MKTKHSPLYPSLDSSLYPQLALVLAALIIGATTSAVRAEVPFLPAIQINDDELNGVIDQDFFQISDDGQQVVFLSTQNFQQELFSVSTNEGSVIRLNPNLVDGGNVEVFSSISRPISPFQISPDGTQVVYIADQRSNSLFELFSVPVTGGQATRLSADLPGGGDVAATGTTADFQIGPNSQQVVYIADQNEDGLSELFSVPIGGGTPIRLNPDLASAFSDVTEFQISSDGQRVLYLADQNNDETFELFSVAITGGSVVRLNGDLVGDVDEFQISADSLRAVYLADQNVFGDHELFSVSIAGGSTTLLNGDFVASGGAASSDVVGFQISNDGSQVVFLADQNINDTFELFSVPIDGGTPVRLNADLIGGGDVIGEFDISADNQRVVYIADQMFDNDFDLFSVPLLGGAVTPLNPPNTDIASTQFLSLLPDNAFAISSDGQQVVFLVGFSGGNGQLFSAPIAGGSAVSLDSVTPGDVTEDFQISPDSQRVLFKPQLGTENLFSVPITGDDLFEPTVQVNGDLPFNGQVANFVISNDGQRTIYLANQIANSGFDLFSSGDFAALATAVLPGSRSVLVGDSATAFATVINTNEATLENCSIAPPLGIAADFFYQTTDPSTNGLVGTPDTPTAIPPGGVQTFVFGFTPTSIIAPTEVALIFDCTNSLAAGAIEGINTLLLSGSQTPVADIVTLGATPSGDGILTIAGTTGSAAFAVASVNVGSAATVVASVDLGSATVPLTLSICETNPTNGQCLSPPGAEVVTTVATNATPTFSIFATAIGDVPFDPANTRIRVRFLEAGQVRGTTSVAVQTQ